MSVEDSPEFQKALKEACEKQWGKWLYGGTFKKSSKRNVEKDLARIQDIKNSAEASAEAARSKMDAIRQKVGQLRQQHNPSLKRITENICVKNNLSRVGLICPKCGNPDRGNTMNGKPWCFICKTNLVSSDKIEKWVDIRQGTLDGVRRRLRGLP